MYVSTANFAHCFYVDILDYSMVDFIKPNFLGSMRDFAEDYANPIKNGQHKDSSRLEVRVMMEKSYVLHKKLSRFVQRRDVTVLKEMLEEKFEYDIFIPMTEIQVGFSESNWGRVDHNVTELIHFRRMNCMNIICGKILSRMVSNFFPTIKSSVRYGHIRKFWKRHTLQRVRLAES